MVNFLVVMRGKSEVLVIDHDLRMRLDDVIFLNGKEIDMDYMIS